MRDKETLLEARNQLDLCIVRGSPTLLHLSTTVDAFELYVLECLVNALAIAQDKSAESKRQVASIARSIKAQKDDFFGRVIVAIEQEELKRFSKKKPTAGELAARIGPKVRECLSEIRPSETWSKTDNAIEKRLRQLIPERITIKRSV